MSAPFAVNIRRLTIQLFNEGAGALLGRACGQLLRRKLRVKLAPPPCLDVCVGVPVGFARRVGLKEVECLTTNVSEHHKWKV